jgi:choline dehydrogenase-like flavoprotein
MNVTSGSDFPHGKVLDCDVVVVGSGGGGAPAAYELASAGLDVIVLEAGPHIRPEDFTQRELDTLTRVYVDKGGQGPSDGSINVLQGSCIGGSTVINAEVCFRTPDYVLEEWARAHHIPDMSPSEMAPVFEDVERMINVTVNEGRYIESGRMQMIGLDKLGLDPKPVSRNVKDCRGCPYCFFGCAYGCKQSMDQSYLPAAADKGARIICDAKVVELHRVRGGVGGVIAKTPAGSLHVEAKATVLACGAIQTPLVLLDHGLGGEQVGRNLALHPVLFVSGWFDEKVPEPRSGMLSVYSDAHEKDGVLFEFGAGSLAFAAPGSPGFGVEHKRKLADIGGVWGGGGIMRDAGMPGRVRRDRKGVKKVDYKLDDDGKRKARFIMRRAAEVYFAGGAKEVSFPITPPRSVTSVDDLGWIESFPAGPADISFVSYHPQGTARLGVVTDYDGQVRGASNLYVMDTSLFPSPTGVNTQVPVMATATVLSRKLAARLMYD